MMGKLLWEWMPQMKQAGLVPILQGWSQHLSINIWHGAGVHRAKTFTTYLEPALFNWLTPPQLNPAEQVFQEVGRHVEGKVYPTLADKRHAVELFLQNLATDPNPVKQLCLWPWVQDALCLTYP